MEENIWNAFTDEIEKIAKAPMKSPTYPISRFITSRRGQAGLGAIEGAVKGGSPVAGALGGGLQAHLSRWVGARGTRGRMRKGGKGLWQFEKDRLADLVGVSPKRIETLIKRVQQKAGGKAKTFPISRFLSHSLVGLPPGQNILARFIQTRGTAGRAKTGYKHFLKQEKKLIADLKEANRAGADISALGRAAKDLPKKAKGVIERLREKIPA
jgi:hypothetical protein